MVPGLTSTNATLTAENSRLNDRMAKLVQDLTEENKHLLDENQRLNDTVQKVQDSSVSLLVCESPTQHTQPVWILEICASNCRANIERHPDPVVGFGWAFPTPYWRCRR